MRSRDAELHVQLQLVSNLHVAPIVAVVQKQKFQTEVLPSPFPPASEQQDSKLTVHHD